jgi:predicted Zn-dependent protease
MLNQVYLPEVRAAISFSRNQPQEAVTHLQSAVPYELGGGPRASLYLPNFVRAEAYLRSHDGAKAAVEYQKILDHRGLEPTNPMYTISHLGLGRAYAVQGDTAKAKAAYQDFFAAWKDADPEVPLLKTARAEYEKLK